MNEILEARAMNYLVKKFPYVKPVAFYTDYTGNVHESLQYASAVCLAAENEKICKACNGAECRIKSKPVIKISESPRGFEYLDVRWSCAPLCKFRPFKNSMLLKSRLKKSQLIQTLANYDTMKNNTLENSLRSAVNASKDHTNLIISGKVGTGKTHLAVGILLENLRQNLQGVFWTAGELLDELKRTNFEGGHSEFMTELQKFPCLVIDDFCLRVPTEPYGSQMFKIIEDRCADGLQTVITANASTIEEFRSALNASWVTPMLSRILENGSWTVLSNLGDYRLKHLRRSENEKQ